MQLYLLMGKQEVERHLQWKGMSINKKIISKEPEKFLLEII
jgi:hypothetical protein